MHVRDYERELMVFDTYRLHKNLLFYVPPILLVMGTLGNVLSAVVLTRRPMRKYSTYFYLAVLSAADTFVLYVGLLRMWIGELTGHDIMDRSTWACKLISFFGYTVSDFSGWLIVAVTAERYVAVCYPLRASNVCSRSRAFKVVLCILSVLLVINVHFCWTVGVKYIHHKGQEIGHCSGGERYRVLIDEVWPWVDAFIYSFIPFLAILVLNAAIIHQVVQARRKRRELQSERHQVAHHDGQHARGRGCTSGDGGKITLMLLTISVTFLVTTLPVNLASITTMFLSKDENRTLESFVTFRLVRTVTELLMYLNHSINFFLYCATGQKFRQQLLRSLAQRRLGHAKPAAGSDYSLCLAQNNHTAALQRQHRSTGDAALLSPKVLLWPKHSSNSLTVTLQVPRLQDSPENVPLRKNSV